MELVKGDGIKEKSVMLERIELWKGMFVSGLVPNSFVNTGVSVKVGKVCHEGLAVISPTGITGCLLGEASVPSLLASSNKWPSIKEVTNLRPFRCISNITDQTISIMAS